MPKKSYLILRTCNPDFTSRGGFIWPKSGLVKAPDWDPKPECGNGLHGLLWGAGDASLLNPVSNAVWLVARIWEYVDLGGKVKFPEAEVLCAGTRGEAVAYIQECVPAGTAVVYGTATAGYRGTATAGYGGTATAGYGGTATAGDHGTATAGYRGTAIAGDLGTAIAGDLGTATAGDHGTATAGYRGTAIAGDLGTAIAGDLGTAIAGDLGTAIAGYDGTLQIKFWDASAKRYRIATGYVGEDGIKPNTPYHLLNGRFTQEK